MLIPGVMSRALHPGRSLQSTFGVVEVLSEGIVPPPLTGHTCRGRELRGGFGGEDPGSPELSFSSEVRRVRGTEGSFMFAVAVLWLTDGRWR